MKKHQMRGVCNTNPDYFENLYGARRTALEMEKFDRIDVSCWLRGKLGGGDKSIMSGHKLYMGICT